MSRLRWGVLGASWIAGRAVIPALRGSSNGRLVAIASRSRERAAAMTAAHGIPTVHEDYAQLISDPAVDAVYVPLPNSLHLEWSQRALAAGKHVLCEKPLAVDAEQAREMAGSAAAAGRLLMEALMYRFHPRVAGLLAELAGTPIRHVHAAFGFPLDAPGNHRLRPDLGGGALLDVGSYCASVIRALLGEPERVEAVARRERVDMSTSAVLSFPGGAQATLVASFETPEHQELVVVTEAAVHRLDRPFTSWRDPHDPYLLMVEAFAEAALTGGPAPIAPSESIANLALLDRIREAAG